MQNNLSIKTLVVLAPIWFVFWMVVHTFVMHRLGFTWQLSAADAMVFTGIVALACISVVLLSRFGVQGKSGRLYQFLYTITISILSANAYQWLILKIYSGSEPFVQFTAQSMPVRGSFIFLMMSFAALLSWLLVSMGEQQVRSAVHNEAEQLVKEAELVKLRQQLQPHFLFNSLNSINALIGSEPANARKMIQQLSDFLRGTLRKDEKQLIALWEEWQHLNLYLDIEKVRFGDRLNVQLILKENARQAILPALILQPLVENAIKFGLYGTTDAITITIEAEMIHDQLSIQIGNPYDADSQSSVKGTGFGLDSVRRRLYLLFSRNDLLHTSAGDSLFITQLKIPQTAIVTP